MRVEVHGLCRAGSFARELHWVDKAVGLALPRLPPAIFGPLPFSCFCFDTLTAPGVRAVGQAAQTKHSSNRNQPEWCPAVTTVWCTELGTTLVNGLKRTTEISAYFHCLNLFSMHTHRALHTRFLSRLAPAPGALLVRMSGCLYSRLITRVRRVRRTGGLKIGLKVWTEGSASRITGHPGSRWKTRGSRRGS
jgi:hypothetical protein